MESIVIEVGKCKHSEDRLDVRGTTLHGYERKKIEICGCIYRGLF